MRLGVAWFVCPNATYRAIDPMKAMARRGHEIVWPRDGNGNPELSRLSTCDLVHVYRRCEADAQRVLGELARSGIPITYDNDDDFTAVPKEAPEYKRLGGLEGQRGFLRSVKSARLARCMTTTNELLIRWHSKGPQFTTGCRTRSWTG